MINVLFQLNSLGYGGTEKATLSLIRSIDKNLFSPSLFFNTNFKHPDYYKIRALSLFSRRYKAKFQEKYKAGFVRLDDFFEATGGRLFVGWGMRDFLECINKVKPDIIHMNRGLPADFYTSDSEVISKQAKIVDYNIFGTRPPPHYHANTSQMLFTSHWSLEKSDWADPRKSHVLYFPTTRRVEDPQSRLRQRLQLPDGSLLIGRLSRPNLDDGDFILKVLNFLFAKYDNLHFVGIGSSDVFKKNTASLSRVHHLPPTTREEEIDDFITSLDVLLHYRKEGETFGLNIAEAMTRGVPVVTHRSEVDNAQVELLTRFRDSGLIVNVESPYEYSLEVERLIKDPGLRDTLGSNGSVTASENFDTNKITRALQSIYLKALEA